VVHPSSRSVAHISEPRLCLSLITVNHGVVRGALRPPFGGDKAATFGPNPARNAPSANGTQIITNHWAAGPVFGPCSLRARMYPLPCGECDQTARPRGLDDTALLKAKLSPVRPRERFPANSAATT
jgi:hypothetical protein